MDVNFEERKYTFDDIAEEYEKIRPTYPKELFQDLFTYANIEKEDRILEIGCGTGKATEGLAQLGYKQIDCIELGEQLAQFTASKFRNENGIHVYQGDFESWERQGDLYSLAVSATAFHFINPEIGYQKVVNLLHKHGTMAFFWTYHLQPDTDVFQEIGACYEKYALHLNSNQLPTAEE